MKPLLTILLLTLPAALSITAFLAWQVVRIGRKNANRYYEPYQIGLLSRKLMVKQLKKKSA